MKNNFVSIGKNPNWEKTCYFPKCIYFKNDLNYNGGWCSAKENKQKFGMPSVASTGGCDLHQSMDK